MIKKSEKPKFKLCEPKMRKECNIEISFLGSKSVSMPTCIKNYFPCLHTVEYHLGKIVKFSNMKK